MKKILFVINHMNIGGIQVSLLEILKHIHTMYDITLLCIRPGGELLEKIPEDVKIVEPGKALLSSEIGLEEARKYHVYIFRLLFSLWSKLCSRRIPAYIITKFLQNNLGEYDVAISYTQPIECKKFYNLANEVVINSCKAKKKITFLHCDYQQYGGNDAVNRRLYHCFDRIAAVSDSVGRKLETEIPDLATRIVTVYNCCDVEGIRQLANQDPIIYSEGFPIVTVARLSQEKGLVRCVKIVKKLHDEGIDIKWHIVGDGICRAEIEQAIVDCSAEDLIILHGQKENPYRYIKNAKLFLLPSYHEAAPMVYKESACLGVPILSTATTSADELVKENKIGFVCGIETESIYKALREYIVNEDVLIESKDVDNIKVIAQFNALIEN